MKMLAGLVLAVSLIGTTHARIAGINQLSVNDKISNGISIDLLRVEKRSQSDSVLDFEYIYGSNNGSFKIILSATVLLPNMSEYGPVRTQVKIGTNKLVLSREISSRLYRELAIDYTPTKISKGIRTGESILKCNEQEVCSVSDKNAGFWLLEGGANKLSQDPRAFYASLYHGRNKFQDLKNEVMIFNSENEVSSELIKEVTSKVFELAPTFFTFEHYATSTPSHDEAITIQQHEKEAYTKITNSFGESDLEKMVVDAILLNNNVTYKEGFRRSSGGSCTYFCGRSGKFITARVTSDISFY